MIGTYATIRPGHFVIPGGKIIPVGTHTNVTLADNELIIEYKNLENDVTDAKQVPFTGKVIIYSEVEHEGTLRNKLKEELKPHGIFLSFRSSEYVKTQEAEMKPVAFISHDSRDKTDIALPLAIQLQRLMLPVWYDEFSLKVGDSLRESIENGLKNCKKCIFILTPNFLNKGGWPKREYDSIFTREIIEEKKLIFPIWHNVSVKDVYEYSPILADRIGLDWNMGVDEISQKLYNALMPLE